MKEYRDLDLLILKIENQQKGKEGTAEFNIGEQLKEIARAEPASAELLNEDLEKKEMSLAEVAKEFKKYADENHEKQKGSCFCITPMVADGLIRKFYGLPDRDEQSNEKTESVPGFLDLGSFL